MKNSRMERAQTPSRTKRATEMFARLMGQRIIVKKPEIERPPCAPPLPRNVAFAVGITQTGPKGTAGWRMDYVRKPMPHELGKEVRYRVWY